MWRGEVRYSEGKRERTDGGGGLGHDVRQEGLGLGVGAEGAMERRARLVLHHGVLLRQGGLLVLGTGLSLLLRLLRAAFFPFCTHTHGYEHMDTHRDGYEHMDAPTHTHGHRQT